MPQVAVGAAISAGASTFFATNAAIAAAGGAFTFFAQRFAFTLVLGALSQSLMKKPSSGAASGVPVSSRQATAAHNIVYGESRVGGTILYMATTGESNQYLHMVIAVAGHEIESFEAVYANDEDIEIDGNGVSSSSSSYGSNIRCQFKYGAANQTAFSDLIGETATWLPNDQRWTSSHKVQGSALAYIRLEYSQSNFPNGIPSFSFIVKGAKVYDPRDTNQSPTDSTTWTYSSNPALCIANYMTNNKYGLACNYETEIDEDALIAAANVCDQQVQLADLTYQNRYEANGSLSTSANPETSINSLLSSMSGSAIFSGGVWRILAGEARTATLTFDENDLRGGLRVQTKLSRRESFNTIKGLYNSKTSSENLPYVLSDFPVVKSSVYIAEDNGEEIVNTIELPFTTHPAMAQRIAKIELLKARQPITLTAQMSLRGLLANVGDIVNINNTRFVWSNKKFEVTSVNVNFGETLGVELGLREYTSTAYDWNYNEESGIDPAPNTGLPNPFSSAAPTVSPSDEYLTNNEKLTLALVLVVGGGNVFSYQFEAEAKKQSDSTWTSLGTIVGTGNFRLVDVQQNVTYDYRVRAISVLGVASTWTTGTHTIGGKTSSPNSASGFRANPMGTHLMLEWDAVTDPDLSYYKIKFSPNLSGAYYSSMIDLASKVARPATTLLIPAATGTYAIKSFDKAGNPSVNAAYTSIDVNEEEWLNLVQTVEESPSFSGTKTDTEIDGIGNLRLSAGEVIGTYEFANQVTTASNNVFRWRLQAFVEFIRADGDEINFDSAGGLFDSRSGLFDGVPSDIDDVSVAIFVSTTKDGSTWSDWKQFAIGDYEASAAKFKAVLTADSVDAWPLISSLKVKAFVEDRVESGKSETSTTVTFAKPFYDAPSVSVTPKTSATGDYFTVSNVSRTGFTVAFYNSSDTAISKTFDWMASGYGGEIT